MEVEVTSENNDLNWLRVKLNSSKLETVQDTHHYSLIHFIKFALFDMNNFDSFHKWPDFPIAVNVCNEIRSLHVHIVTTVYFFTLLACFSIPFMDAFFLLCI